ncbi:MAG: phosphoglucomutase [Acidimicrobiales bacterium]
MSHPRAGQLALPDDLVDVAALVTAYFTVHPDPGDPDQRVAFGTSGHRGTSLDGSFNEDHIAATTQAICEYRAAQGITGPLFLGKDTHALSEPSAATALEVLAGNGVTTMIDVDGRFTPTPAVSLAILRHNRSGTNAQADGIVVTPSHNPPTDGGFKYNPPHGGPADTDATGWIADRANELMANGNRGVTRMRLADAMRANTTHTFDYRASYVADLATAIDFDAIRSAGVRIGADPLGGASVDYWGAIAEHHGIDLTVINPLVDPTWRFMTLDWDGKIRMDCSSPDAMASLIANRDAFDLSTGNDADADRHGIVTPDGGLMNRTTSSLSRSSTSSPIVPDGQRARHRQDPGLELDDRPCGRRTRADAGRGPGRLQMVRAGTARRVGRFRRRGVRRRLVPPHRRHHLDHRQGRPAAVPAGRRDHRRHLVEPQRTIRSRSPNVMAPPPMHGSTLRRTVSRRTC